MRKIIERQEGIGNRYVYFYNEIPIGEVLVNYQDSIGDINYRIRNGYRGQGHEYNLLLMIEKELYGKVCHLTANVSEKDVCSQVAFEKTGYFSEKRKNVVHYKKHIENRKDRIEDGQVMREIIFLTNNRSGLEIFSYLKQKHNVSIISSKLSMEDVKRITPSYIVSYNYMYRISEEIINYMMGNVINLHISLLPWNRGASPNIWSFIDNTPKGVTIHKVDKTLDTGGILAQKEVDFDAESETFSSTYRKLNLEVQGLFKDNWEKIIKNELKEVDQGEKGSYHSKKDLQLLQEKLDFSWDDNIADFLKRYRRCSVPNL